MFKKIIISILSGLLSMTVFSTAIMAEEENFDGVECSVSYVDGNIVIESANKDFLNKLYEGNESYYYDNEILLFEDDSPNAYGFMNNGNVHQLDYDDGKLIISKETINRGNLNPGNYWVNIKVNNKCYVITTIDLSSLPIMLKVSAKAEKGYIQLKFDGEMAEKVVSSLVRGYDANDFRDVAYLDLVTNYEGNDIYGTVVNRYTNDKTEKMLITGVDSKAIEVSIDELKDYGFFNGIYTLSVCYYNQNSNLRAVAKESLSINTGVDILDNNNKMPSGIRISTKVEEPVAGNTSNEVFILNGETDDGKPLELTAYWAECFESYGHKYYEITDDKKFVAGKTYYLIIRQSFIPKKDIYNIALDLNGKEYKMSIPDYGFGSTLSTYINPSACYEACIEYTAKDYPSQATPAKTSITSIVNSSSGITLKWKSSSGATAYRVYRSINGSAYELIETTEELSLYDKTATKSGSNYSYKIIPINKTGSTTVKGSASSAKDIIRLAKTSITSIVNSSSGITLKWKSSSGATAYRVYRSINGSAYELIETTEELSLYDKTATKSGSNYSYKIVPINKTGSTTVKGSASSVKDIIRLSRTAITELENTSSGITITYKKVSAASGYYIYRSVDGSSYSKIKTITKNSTVSYTDKKAATAKQKYYYKVIAFYDDNGIVIKAAASTAKSITRK